MKCDRFGLLDIQRALYAQYAGRIFLSPLSSTVQLKFLQIHLHKTEFNRVIAMAFKGAIVLLWLCTATLTWITVEGQGILGKFRDGIKNMLQLTISQVIFFYDL